MALDWKKTSKWWYGRFEINGRVKLVNLNVQIKGKRPKSISGDGNEAFRLSRERAIVAHDQALQELSSKRNAENLTQRLIELKRGTPLQCTKLADLPHEWATLERKRPLSDKYKKQGIATLQRFVDFVSRENAHTQDLLQVSKAHVKAFMNAEDKRGVTPRTWNYTLTILKGAFNKLEPHASAYTEYLVKTPLRDLATINREPFTADELQSIIKTAQNDDFIRPIILMGAYTAMRRGDCCLLKWTDVDLKEDFITINTHKTGKVAEIAILPELHTELLRHRNNGSQYVFPEQAEMYIKNADGITWRISKLFEAVGFCDNPDKSDPSGAIRKKRVKGLLRASIRNFHSLRVTGATNLLAAGIPPEEVIKITGHETVDVLMKHYDQRNKEQRRASIRTAMKNLSPINTKTREEKLREILEKMKPKQLREEALRILDGTD